MLIKLGVTVCPFNIIAYDYEDNFIKSIQMSDFGINNFYLIDNE